MCRVTARDSRCEHCSRFSHCNNNDLVCLSKFRELERILDEYEGYGGALDEGRAWADEAMASREKLKEIKQVSEDIIKMNYGLSEKALKILEMTKED